MTQASTLPAPTRLSLEEYLSTSFHPDREFIRGKLKEKPVVAPVHGRTQLLIGVWFERFEEEWKIQGMVEVRTQVNRDDVRLPDVAITPDGALPEKALLDPPLIAIEVLSECDTFVELEERATDYATMGTRNIWLIDPETSSAWVFARGSWQKTTEPRLAVENSPVYLDLDWLWRKLERARGIDPAASK